MNRVARKFRFLIPGILVALATGLASTPREALSQEPLAQPAGKIVLTVTGKIGNTNAEGAANFDIEMLHALGVKTLRTSTPWTDGTQEFSGVLMSDLLATVGALGDEVEAVALNNYSYSLEVEDFVRYPVLLATGLNGQALRIREKGPLWIVYPWDEYIELQTEATNPKMVWQLRRLVVK